MKRSFIILIHFGFWLCYLLLIVLLVSAMVGSQQDVDGARFIRLFKINTAFVLIPSIISFYGFYFIVFPKEYQKSKLFKLSTYAIIISLCTGFLGCSSMIYFFGSNCIGEGREISFVVFSIVNSIITLVVGIVALVIKGFITWFDEIKLKESLLQKTHDMELALVKSQLDPHFMFNTINNIDVLILKDPNIASDYLIKLSDIMRFMLFETKTETILLAKEIQYIEKYITLQKIRTSNLNYINYKVSGKSDNKTIAPMVFIPFIENAFKHTPNKKIEDAINIEIIITEEKIELVCINKINTISPIIHEDGGIGNDLIIKRLNLIYPKKHTLVITNENNLYRVHLTIWNGKI